jgi:hypothetical protein
MILRSPVTGDIEMIGTGSFKPLAATLTSRRELSGDHAQGIGFLTSPEI